MWLEADLGGPERVNIGLVWNYTGNCAWMWRAAGADIAEFDGHRAVDCLPALTGAIALMRDEPERFKALDPTNGWGSYDTLLPALDRLVVAFTAAPNAYVRVSR